LRNLSGCRLSNVKTAWKLPRRSSGNSSAAAPWTTIERGFIEQRAAMAELRATMDAGFAEQRAALERSSSEERAAWTESIRELRLEMQRGFRWTFSALLAILAMVMGIIARLAGAY
jgi:hypothetical protein